MAKKQQVGNVKRAPNSGATIVDQPQTDEGISDFDPNQSSVVVNPPEDEAAGNKDATMQKKSAGGLPVKTLSSLVQNLIGLPLDVVVSSLEEMKNQKQLNNFLVVPVGATVATVGVAGRVQVVRDHNNNVLDIVIG